MFFANVEPAPVTRPTPQSIWPGCTSLLPALVPALSSVPIWKNATTAARTTTTAAADSRDERRLDTAPDATDARRVGGQPLTNTRQRTPSVVPTTVAAMPTSITRRPSGWRFVDASQPNVVPMAPKMTLARMIGNSVMAMALSSQPTRTSSSPGVVVGVRESDMGRGFPRPAPGYAVGPATPAPGQDR